MSNITNRLPQDSLGNPIQAANSFRTYDGATSAIESPIAILTANEQLITIPENALYINIYTDQLIKIGITSADVGGTGNGYSFLVASDWVRKDIAGTTSFYIRNDSGSTANIQFDFAVL